MLLRIFSVFSIFTKTNIKGREREKEKKRDNYIAVGLYLYFNYNQFWCDVEFFKDSQNISEEFNIFLLFFKAGMCVLPKQCHRRRKRIK